MASTTIVHSWIHHDSQADSKSLSSQKSQVFRHVAAHRKWTRHQRTCKLRASALDLYHTFQVQGKQSPQIETHFTGSCDPFDTLAVPHTSQIDELLQFDYKLLSPAFGVSKIPQHRASMFLQDELAAYGFLARIATIKARFDPNPEVFNFILKLKAKAMQQLRLNLSQTAIARLPRAVISLLYAETWCQNLEAVTVHVRLLEAINNHHGLKPDDLICILHSDIQRATLTLGSPLFMMDDKTWDIYEADYAPSPQSEDNDSNDIQWPQLRLLVNMRNALMALDVLQASEMSKAVRQSATIKFLHIMRVLVDQYNTSSDNIEQYTALAALYELRREANMEKIPLGAINVYDAGKLILSRIRQLLGLVSDDPPSLRLWVLFVGTMSGDNWFKQEFQRQVSGLGLVNADDIRTALHVIEHRELPDSLIDPLLGAAA
ncbi:uncharacterized protein A1O5_06986 [Cladophialophora psammophila CBS 110553]|uniref:Uncharacterized protein n=1 Tax=Cladophialophora psammophila CBS 110553 TaxID=1182543 RepID=W9WPT6_9EURO|nr:uncharacterized protein A1O5_06986 [Cladophialophora psammophila CBS 110553]EXJ69913.1 hypothetical protein A1O5_06986 [Cladophialophora psammophila CBS 110553]